MRCLFLSCCALLLGASSLQGQQDLGMLEFFTGASSVVPGNPVYLTRASSLVGEAPSTLMLTDWEEAKVYLHDTVVVEVMARYNIQLDRMEYMTSPDTIRQLYPQQVRLISFNDHLFLPLEYYRDFTVRIGWFEVMVAGELTFLVQREGYRRKTDYHPGVMQVDNYEWDVRDTFFYLRKGDGMPTYFYPSKKKILDLFEGHRSQMKEFWKENHLRPRQKKDLKLAFIQYNQLVDAEADQ
jgi:hypothetical protein